MNSLQAIAARLASLIHYDEVNPLGDEARDRIKEMADALAADAGLRALIELADCADKGSPPDDWEPFDRAWGDYCGYGHSGQDPKCVREVDVSNAGDVHAHGCAVGRWGFAVKARAALNLLTKGMALEAKEKG